VHWWPLPENQTLIRYDIAYKLALQTGEITENELPTKFRIATGPTSFQSVRPEKHFSA